jgi:hypothetical protein
MTSRCSSGWRRSRARAASSTPPSRSATPARPPAQPPHPACRPQRPARWSWAFPALALVEGWCRWRLRPPASGRHRTAACKGRGGAAATTCGHHCGERAGRDHSHSACHQGHDHSRQCRQLHQVPRLLCHTVPLITCGRLQDCIVAQAGHHPISYTTRFRLAQHTGQVNKVLGGVLAVCAPLTSQCHISIHCNTHGG